MIRAEDLMVVVFAMPVIAALIASLAGTDISERHHAHHDTYGVPLVASRALVLVMVFMGVLGGLVGWLCRLGVFATDPLVPLSFFVSFEVAILVLLIVFVRYQVMVYDDHITVRQAFVHSVSIPYDQIDDMEWVWSFLGARTQDLRISAQDGTSLRVWSLLDIEQILLRIDLFDTLDD